MTVVDHVVPRTQQAGHRPGFLLYVGLDPQEHPVDGTTLNRLVGLAEDLGELARDALPGAQTLTALSLSGRAPVAAALDAVRAELVDAQRPDDPRPPGRPPNVVVDLDAHQAFVDGEEAPLTRTEFRLLRHLLRSPRRAVGREDLLRTVWDDRDLPAGTRTIDVHVRRLRHKLRHQGIVTTVRGSGYRFDPSPEVTVLDARAG